MPPTRTRQVTVIDLALLSGFAILSGWTVYATDREYSVLPSFPREGRSWSRSPAWIHRWHWSACRLNLDTLAFLGVLSVALAVITYGPRCNRPGRSGPGHIAVALAAILVLNSILREALHQWITPLIPLPPGTSKWVLGLGPPYYLFWPELPLRIAWALMAAWITLAMTGGWRRSIDWTDRLGRWLGWAWIGAYLWDWLLRV